MPRNLTPRSGGDASRCAPKTFASALMLRACRLALGLMLTACAAMAQTGSPWRMQAPLPTADDLNGVSVVSPTEAWAVGDGGTILHTTDGGVTWGRQESGTVAQLNAVAFLDSQRGWAVGNTALYTIDGGETWHEGARTGNLSTLYQVAFADADNVFAPVGSGTGLLRSTDGGRNWALQDIGAFIVSVQFFDPQNGIAAGAGVFYTRDGGKTWQKQSEVRPAAFYLDFERAWQLNNSVKVNGLTRQTLDYSTDGGRTFTLGATPQGTYASSLFFLDPLNGWGVGTRENIVRTGDGGLSWQTQHGGLDSPPANKYVLNAVEFADALNGIAVGNSGVILTTSDGGAAWTPRNNGSQASVYEIYAADSEHAWTANDDGEVLYTSDGGRRWSRAGVSAGTTVSDIRFTDNMNGWVSTEGGPQTSVWRSTDGGATWQPTAAPMASMFTVDTADGKTIVAAGWDGNVGVIMRSTDGGATWSHTTNAAANWYDKVHFVNASTGWLVGNRGAILKTTDGGATWAAQDSGLGMLGMFQDVSFADENNGWVAGGGHVLHTTDGGRTWAQQDAGASIYSVHAVSPAVAWVCGYDGFVARTTDGGRTWQRESVGTEATFNAAFFLDAERGWVVGEASTVAGFEGRIYRRDADSPAPRHTISGRLADQSGAPIVGAFVNLQGSYSDTLITDADGRYAVSLPAGGAYSVAPYKEGYTFEPQQREFESLAADEVVDFVGALPAPVSIGGRVSTSANASLSGVTVTLGGSQSATTKTDPGGRYNFAGLPAGGSYTVTASGGYGFLPPSRSYAGLSSVVADADFTAVTLTNLALRKTATQSSTGWGGAASRAVDGNTDGNWANNSVTATFNDQHAWWEVDLGEVGQINHLGLWNRTDCCRERLSDFYVLVSDVPFTSQDLQATIGQPGVWSSRRVGMIESAASAKVGRTGRYVRIQMTGTNYLSLAEVQVMGHWTGAAPSVSVNLARGKAAAQSSTGWGGVASRATDGNTDGNWANSSVTTTFSDTQAWWEVDLGSPQQISSVKVWNRTDCCGERLSNFHVLVSDTPFTSNSLADSQAQAGVSSFHTAGAAGRPTTVGVNRVGRYVRVQLAGTNYLSLAEVEVWGSQAATTTQPNNLSVGKQATQSSTGWGGVASRAVDGVTDGDWAKNSVTATLNDSQAWWEVDLGAVVNIQNVKLWNRTDCCGERLSDFHVIVSDTPFASQGLQATLSQAGVSGYRTTGALGTQATTTVNRTGRYVRIQLTGNNYLSLSEVQVWGTPMP